MADSLRNYQPSSHTAELARRIATAALTRAEDIASASRARSEREGANAANTTPRSTARSQPTSNSTPGRYQRDLFSYLTQETEEDDIDEEVYDDYGIFLVLYSLVMTDWSL
jgi:hypothetical protein